MLGNFTHLQDHISSDDNVYTDLNPGDQTRLEAGQFHAQVIGARRQQGDSVGPEIVADSCKGHSSRNIGGRHLGTRNRGPALVHDNSGNRTGDCLSEERRRDEEKGQHGRRDETLDFGHSLEPPVLDPLLRRMSVLLTSAASITFCLSVSTEPADPCDRIVES